MRLDRAADWLYGEKWDGPAWRIVALLAGPPLLIVMILCLVALL